MSLRSALLQAVPDARDEECREVERLAKDLDPATPPCLLIRANDIAFGGALRSVAAAGGQPICATFDWPGSRPWFSSASRHFRNEVTIPNPATDVDGCVRKLRLLGAALLELFSEHVFAVPSSDTVQLVFHTAEAQLAPFYRLYGSPDFSSFRKDAAHKGRFFEALKAAAPEFDPDTLSCAAPQAVAPTVDAAATPCVVKPAVKDFGQSFYRRHNGLKAIEIHDRATLRDTLSTLIGEGYDLVVQRKIDFEAATDEVPFYAYVNEKHDVTIAACGVKEVIQPFPFGTATVLRLSWSPELLTAANKIAKMLRWTGPLMIEFIRERSTGRHYVIEINTRPWLFHDFYRRMGLPFLGEALRQAAGASEQTGLRTPDADALAAARPLHVDLFTLMERSPEEALDRIRSVSPFFTLAHGSEEDPKPLEMLAAALADQRSARRSAVDALISEASPDQDMSRILP